MVLRMLSTWRLLLVQVEATRSLLKLLQCQDEDLLQSTRIQRARPCLLILMLALLGAIFCHGNQVLTNSSSRSITLPVCRSVTFKVDKNMVRAISSTLDIRDTIKQLPLF